jgi:hypothetical protein
LLEHPAIAFIYPIKTKIMLLKTPTLLLFILIGLFLTACGSDGLQIAQSGGDSTETEVDTTQPEPTPKPKMPNFEDEDWGNEELFDEDEMRRMMKKAKKMQEMMEEEFFDKDDPEIPLKAKISCHPDSVSDDLIENIKVAINKKHMDDDKLLKAKIEVNEVCLLSAHVRDICEIFMLDDTKLAFAKFALGRTADPENFRKVTEAFSFPKTKRKLQTYVMEQFKEQNSAAE